MAGFSKSARAGDVIAIYQRIDGENNGGVRCSAFTTGPSKEATAVRNAEAGVAGAAQALGSSCKVSLGA